MTALVASLVSDMLALEADETPEQYRDRTGRCPRGYRFQQDKDRCLTKGGPSGKKASEGEPYAVPEDRVRAMEKHVDKVKEISSLNPIAAYRKQLQFDDLISEYDALPQESKFILSTARAASGEFEREAVRNKELHTKMAEEWAESTNSAMSHRIQGVLAAMGVSGSSAPEDQEEARAARAEGSKSKELREWVEDVRAFTQAYFKKNGIEEVTVYRGVKGLEGEPGEEIGLECREASSFSLSAKEAKRFSDKVVAMRVPVSRIFLTPTASSELTSLGEKEIVVMGASDLKGTLL